MIMKSLWRGVGQKEYIQFIIMKFWVFMQKSEQGKMRSTWAVIEIFKWCPEQWASLSWFIPDVDLAWSCLHILQHHKFYLPIIKSSSVTPFITLGWCNTSQVGNIFMILIHYSMNQYHTQMAHWKFQYGHIYRGILRVGF